MKKLIHTQRGNTPHWVGDGFPVRSIFTYHDLAREISPFLLMDYAGPTEFTPLNGGKRRGVGEHPHRGFETVTIVYSGEVEHRDSSGGGGIIRNGDVQWMTAASGLVHEEFHGPEFSRTGGRFEMVQLWVNLPRKFKMVKPRYQGIVSEKIPVHNFAKNAGTLRVIAGEYENHKGPAQTYSPVNVWDVKIKAGNRVVLNVPENHTATVFVLKGEVQTETSEGEGLIGEAELGVFETKGTELVLNAKQDSTLLFLGGEPLNEPIAAYGPFVMNSPQEIHQAFQDFQDGKMGVLERIEGAE